METTNGQRLRELRTAAGWSQRELSKRVGRSHSQVVAWEQGRNVPTPKVALQLERLFGTEQLPLVGWYSETAR
jgi:transcriptional regulator with XRE-family HTH domain